MLVYKVVVKCDDNSLVSAVIGSGFTRTYYVNKVTTGQTIHGIRTPLFAFDTLEHAYRFINGIADGLDGYFIYEAEAELYIDYQVLNLPSPAYAKHWWDAKLKKRKSAYPTYALPVGTVLCKSITLIKECDESL